MASALDLLIAIKATDNASSELKKVQGAISGLGDAAVNVGKVLATGLAAGAAAVAAGLGASANAAAGFEQTMSGVKAVSGATADQMKQLSQKALELGKATVFSASEAGQGIEELVKGGVSIDDVMNGAAQATLNLASAGGVDLVTAATIASNALNGFNLKGADMAHISDVIAGAANASAIDVNEFGLAMAQSSAVASTVGLSFDDLAVAIAEMGNAGIKGADAGTSLKTMFLNLEPSTKRAANEMKALGIITDDEVNHFFDAEGHAKSLAEISGVLANATKDLTDEEKLQALQMLFGTDAVRAAAVMAKNGAEGFDTLAASMAKVSAEDVAKERLNNLKGDLEQLKGSVETAAISLGLALLPALRDAAQGATDFVNGLIPLIEESGPAMVVMLKDAGTGIVTFAGRLRDNASGALQGIADKLADTGAAWAPWAAQAGPAGEAVGSALSGASGAVQALQMLLQGNFGGALAAARDSMKDFAAAADSLRAMFDQLIPQVDRDEIWNNLKDAVKLAGDAFALLWPEIQKTAGETGTTAESAGSLSGSLKDLSAGVKDVAATFGPIIETAIRVGTALDAVSDASTKAGISLHNTTVDRVISDFQQLEDVSHTLGQSQIDLHNTIVEAWSTMTAAIQAAMSSMTAAIGSAMSDIGTTVGDGFSALGTTVQSNMTAIQGFFSDTWNQIPEDIRADLEVVSGLIVTDLGVWLASMTSGMAEIGASVLSGWTAVTTAVGTAMSDIGTAVQNGWTAITGTTNTSTEAMTSDIQTTWDTILAATAAAWDGLSTAIGTALDAALTAVGTWVADILGKFTGLAGDMGRAGAEAGQALVDGLTGAITGGIKAVGDKAAEIARGTLDAAKDALGAQSPSKEFAKLGVNIGEGLIQGIQSMKAETAAEMNAILKAAVSGIKSSGGGGFLTIPQFGSAIRSLGFNESTISAICGPIAAQGIAEGLGKSISLIDVEAISTKIGAYAKGAGTFGSGAFQKILSAIGIDSRSGSFQEAVDAAMKGIPVAISTPLHYFLAQGFDQATQQFVVGNTGTALKAGAEKMTRAAIEGVAGAATFIIPAVQAAGGAIRTLATDIATGFDSVATPAVFDLEAAITDLVGTNELWSQLDANASQTGRDLATFLGDIAAPGVELVTSSLSELQAMSGLTLPQIQVQAEATGKDLRHWLLEVGVPSAVRLAEEFKALQDRAGPALEATGVSLRVLAHDIEASFTSTAPTAIDKFFSLLEKLATDVDAAGDDIASKMKDIATKVASGIAKATEDGGRQIADAMRSAQDQLDQLGGSLADPTSTTVKQSGLAGEISAAKSLIRERRRDADELHSHQQSLESANAQFTKDTAKAAIQLEKDLARAKSDVDKSGIKQKADDARAQLNEAHKAQIDSIDASFALRVAENARTKTLDAADRAAELVEDAKMVKFRQAAIIAERDAKILAAQQATTDKLAEVQDLATKERKILAQSYIDKIADLKAGLLDKLPGLTGEAAVVVNGVFDQVATRAAGVTGTITGGVSVAADAAQTLVDTYGVKIEEANAIVNDHGAVVKRVLGVDVPGSLGLTDTAVEEFAAAFGVSWNTAREMLEATGKLSDAVMGKQIPGAAKDAAKVIDDSLGVKVPKSVGLTGTALDLAGVSAGNLKKPVNDATAAAKSFAKDGLDVAKDAASDFGSKQGEIAASITTQIAAVLLRLRDGLLGEGDYKGKGLIQAVKDLGTALLALPTDIKVNITTNQTGGLMAGVAGAGPAEFAQSGISEGSNRNAPAGNVSPFPGHIGESGPGGKYNDPTTGKPYTRAVGGPVRGGVPVIVGEHRPELFTPQSSGWISSSVAGGGGVGIDYQRLGMELAKAMQNAPAPRVAVEDIRSSLVAVGMRNGGQVGLA